MPGVSTLQPRSTTAEPWASESYGSSRITQRSAAKPSKRVFLHAGYHGPGSGSGLAGGPDAGLCEAAVEPWAGAPTP